MMDVTVSLMNQYTMIVNRMSAPITNLNASNTINEQQPSTSSPSTNWTPSSADVAPSEMSKQVNASRNDDSEAGPSMSESSQSIETFEIDGNTVKIEDIGLNDTNDTNDTQSELRRRRLQRFDNKTEDS